jgi:hypothetical protein
MMMFSTSRRRTVVLCSLAFVGCFLSNNQYHVTASSLDVQSTTASTTMSEEELYASQHQRRKLTWDFFSFLLMSTFSFPFDTGL